LILGIPVISTECSGALELLGENNEYGIVTENSENGIYLGLKQMITDPGLLQHYKKQASERGKKFSIQKTINAVEDMLDNLE
jgi:glycosyltransferase involved in cell wall biosynthesis